VHAPDIAAKVERTRTMCQNNPTMASIRDQLLDIELAGHQRGWDHPANMAKLFQMELTRSTEQAEWCLTSGFQLMFDGLLDQTNGNPAASVRHLARMFHHFGVAMRSGDIWADVPQHLQDQIPKALRDLVIRPADVDLIPPRDDNGDTVVHGFGVAGEVWVTEVVGEDAGKRHEQRHVAYAGRDGHTWFVSRRRDAEPTVYHEHPADTDVAWNPWITALGAMVSVAVLDATAIRIGPELLVR
jgi:hypothetical protein